MLILEILHELNLLSAHHYQGTWGHVGLLVSTVGLRECRVTWESGREPQARKHASVMQGSCWQMSVEPGRHW